MCNKGIGCLGQSPLQSDTQIDQRQLEAVYLMDSPSATPGSVPSSNDENPRVKFLCSFSGSILPRPQDGKLRYVGGETRIVSVPRDITYEELMGKMRELYEGATALKYQQPDEDLDALVSVVNDDDVTNMMEEYDKLGSGDGFTRLRIFLFLLPDQDGSSHFVDVDERDTERRYVDALNNLNESPESRKQQPNESLVTSPVDDIHVAEQYFNQTSLEGSLHSQRNCEMPLPQFNLRHLTIPHMGSGQHQQSITQRYNEMEPPWSPAYYSPRHLGHHDPRPDFPTSPSSARYRTHYGEFSEKCLDRMSEEYGRQQQVNHQGPYDHQPQFSDNVVWLPSGPISSDKAGFPGNILHGPNVFEGNSICEHCRMTFQRNQPYLDSSWKHGEQPHLEQPNMGNGFQQVANPCPDCPPNRETFVLNTDTKLHPGFYPREQNDPRSLYNESHNHEIGWILQHQSNPRTEEPRSHISGAGRLNDHYIVDGTGMNIPLGHGNLSDGHHVPSSYVHHEDPRYIQAGSELANEVFHDQAVATGSHIHIPPIEERGVRYGNLPYAYGVPHGHVPAHALWRNIHNPMHGAPSYEGSSLPQQANGTVSPGFVRGTLEGSPRFGIGVENQNLWVESSQKMAGFDGSVMPEYSYAHALNTNTNSQENHRLFTPDPLLSQTDMLNFDTPTEPVQLSDSASTLINENLASLTTSGLESRNDTNINESVRMEENSAHGGGKETNQVEKVEDTNVQCISAPELNKNPDEVASPESINSNCLRPTEECSVNVKPYELDACAPLENEELAVNRLSFLPELIASVKKAALEGVEEVKAKFEENADSGAVQDVTAKEETRIEPEPVDAQGDLNLDPDNDNLNNSKIEPTKAEAEAISRGLQTIKNDDLEEFRELGSGTYGAVYHGKWKGSDVAIKRIKASCFAGRPSERERLIADFWKEALLLSSLHHPNVVSFYGIVRDGPDGSLATVTEFMVNGSLKQFLQKKDRTIDRRKRLIIAMDAAFGMEYLHGKNIVHFDLKCENLLVNMRDPHRPVCKIGDLGLSKVKQHTLVSGGVRGTLPWMAPELLSGKSNMVTEKIDVYSFGIVMWELLTGDEPYADMHCASIIGGIVNNTLRPQIPTWCDPEWKSLMESCWASDPAQRLSFSEISQRLRNMAAAINMK
uniref:Protein kinase domain-containing protein n=1 Tax=Davidia involucrata TaxID=16924 RepID=A0A5B7B2A2_DAVIN